MKETRRNKNRNKNRANVRWGVVGMLALFVAAASFAFPAYANKAIDKMNSSLFLGLPHVPESSFNLGLDLQGGVHLVYEADLSEIPREDKTKALQGVRDVIERRVSGIGVSDASVRTSKVDGKHRINVELPGVEGKSQAIKKIGKTPILEFKESRTTTPDRKLTDKQKKQKKEYNEKAKQKAEKILKQVKKNPDDFKQIAKNKSEDESSKKNGGYMGYISSSSSPKLYDWAKQAQRGDISTKLIKNREGFNVLRRGSSRAGKKKVKLNHILICYVGAQDCNDPIYTKKEAKARVQQLFKQANGYNFDDLAVKYSDDKETKDQGGKLGFLTKEKVENKFNKNFVTTTFEAQNREIIGPLETEKGFHIVYKRDEKVAKEYELWRILIKTKSKKDILPPQSPWKKTKLSGSQLEGAEVVTDQRTGQVQVSLLFDDKGQELFKKITKRNIGKRVGIFLDGKPISIPRVNQVIPDGRAVITGNFTIQQAQQLAQRLNAGALPVPIDLISQQGIGASLGQESLIKSLKAGIIAVIIVMMFMTAFYRIPGLISTVALSIYIALTLALYKLIGVTLTLAGIAGFILSIGMAVDANVLIFERLKEELRSGKTLKKAVEKGFLRAWTSIRDGNVSTLITCFFLLMFGSSFVEGFAITLSIGILLSMFSAITITRLFLRFVVPWFNKKGNVLFLGSKRE